MQILAFATIGEIFLEAVHSEVWCSVATLDTHNRLRSRVLHPIWENHGDHTIGWIATGRDSLKARHLAHNPSLSLCYMKNPFKPVYADCMAAWEDDMSEKRRLWELLGTTPPPLGYNLASFFESVENPNYGLLKLTPWRIELGDLFGEAQVWQG